MKRNNLAERNALILLSSQWEIHSVIPNFPLVVIRLMCRCNYHHKPLPLLTNETKLASTCTQTKYCVIVSSTISLHFNLASLAKICSTKGKERHFLNSPFRTKRYQNSIPLANIHGANLLFTLVLEIIELFYNSSISAKFCQNPASIDGEEQTKKLPPVGIEPRTS